MAGRMSRRQAVGVMGASVAAAGCGATAEGAESSRKEPFRYGLNTSTIQGGKIPIEKQVKIAADAGYQGIEIWIRDLQKFIDGGGKTAALKRRIADTGLSVESAIGFARWCVDDDAERAKGLEQLKREMGILAEIGAKRIAAPPAGATRTSGMDLRKIAGRYRAILELGRKTGVTPQLEIWGPSKTLSRAAEAAYVAVETAHPDACLLLDVYHLYRGGTDFEGLRMINGAAMHGIHMNDYPADPPREQMKDSHRVYPGDGVAPLNRILKILHGAGFRGFLSLELFNREYWKRPPEEVAKTGLRKMKEAVARAFA